LAIVPLSTACTGEFRGDRMSIASCARSPPRRSANPPFERLDRHAIDGNAEGADDETLPIVATAAGVVPVVFAGGADLTAGAGGAPMTGSTGTVAGSEGRRSGATVDEDARGETCHDGDQHSVCRARASSPEQHGRARLHQRRDARRIPVRESHAAVRFRVATLRVQACRGSRSVRG